MNLFRLVEAIDSIYPILARGLLFFPPYKKVGSLVGAYVGAAFVFSSPSQISFLRLEIERWFSYFPSVVSKSLKLYHASNDDYCTLEASPTFHKNVSSFVLPRDLVGRML
jgi:hypothetical protein